MLGSCAEQAPITAGRPEHMKLLFGISFGHPDNDDPAARYEIGRVPASRSVVQHSLLNIGEPAKTFEGDLLAGKAVYGGLLPRPLVSTGAQFQIANDFAGAEKVRSSVVVGCRWSSTALGGSTSRRPLGEDPTSISSSISRKSAAPTDVRAAAAVMPEDGAPSLPGQRLKQR